MSEEEIKLMSKLQENAIRYKFLKRNNMIFDMNKYYDDYVLFELIQRLKQENQQLKDIIKEIKAYVMANCLYNFKYDEDELFEIITDEKASDELMEILDKVKE